MTDSKFKDIDEKYVQLGGPNGCLGQPVADVEVCPDGVGYYRHFQYGSIYWHPETGTHEVHGDIYEKWASLGWERSPLGYPTTDEMVMSDGVGCFNHFQHGSIYWTPGIGAHEVRGEIREKWASLGWERSLLGYPTTDEMVTSDGVGRFNHFQHSSIYWHPETGAHEVHGDIRDKWASLGWERSRLGYPVSDEYSVEVAGRRYRENRFQGGKILWSAEKGAKVLFS